MLLRGDGNKYNNTMCAIISLAKQLDVKQIKFRVCIIERINNRKEGSKYTNLVSQPTGKSIEDLEKNRDMIENHPLTRPHNTKLIKH